MADLDSAATASAKLRPCGETRYYRSRSWRRPGSRTRCKRSRTCCRPAGSGGGSSAPGWPACSGGRTGSTPQTRGSCLPCQHSRPQQRRVSRSRSSTRRVHLRAQRINPSDDASNPRRSPPQLPECREKPAPLAHPCAFGYHSRAMLSRAQEARVRPRQSPAGDHPNLLPGASGCRCEDPAWASGRPGGVRSEPAGARRLPDPLRGHL